MNKTFQPGLLPRLAGVLVVLLGVMTLIGWAFDVVILKTVFPGLTSMKVNTAVCFVLAGCSLLLQAAEPVTSQRLRCSRVLAAILVVAGALTLTEYLVGVDLWLDELLTRDNSTVPGALFPGRMSPATSLNFILIGLAQMTLDVPWGRKELWPAQYLSLAAAVVTLLAFIGCFYGVEGPYPVGQYFAIALHSVFGFCLLCIGILFARPRRGVMSEFIGDHLGGILARRMLPAAILVPLIAGWLRVAGQRAGLYGLGFGSALSTTLLIVTFASLVVWAAKVLNRADAERRKGAEVLCETNARLDAILTSATESERREHARRMELEALMESAPAVVWIAHDPQCQRITGNRTAQEMLRVSPETNVSMTAPAPDRLQHFQIFKGGLLLPDEALPMQVAGREGKSVLGQELQLRFADGSTRWIYGNAVPLMKADGAVRGVVAAFVDITALKQAEQELGLSRENLRGLAARLQEVREEERTTLAREIHDVLAQELTRLKIDITWARRQLGQPAGSLNQERLKEKLASMSELTDAAIGSVQKIATELRPVVLDSLGLCAAIEWQANDFQARTGIECSVRLPDSDLRLEREPSTALFRILQESLTNVARHAQATRVEIQLRCEGDSVALRVWDNGRGIRPEELSNPRSVGLLGMRERAALLGGECRITNSQNSGTCVEARLGLRLAAEPSLSSH